MCKAWPSLITQAEALDKGSKSLAAHHTQPTCKEANKTEQVLLTPEKTNTTSNVLIKIHPLPFHSFIQSYSKSLTLTHCHSFIHSPIHKFMSTQLSLCIQSNICMSFVGIKSLLSWLPPQFEHIKSSRAFSTLPPLLSHFTTGSKEAVQMILYAPLK